MVMPAPSPPSKRMMPAPTCSLSKRCRTLAASPSPREAMSVLSRTRRKASIIWRRPTRARHLIPYCGPSPRGWRKSQLISGSWHASRERPSISDKLTAIIPFPARKPSVTSASIMCQDLTLSGPIPSFRAICRFHRAAGVRLFKVLQDNISSRRVRVELSTPAIRLITGAHGEICGVMAQRDGRMFAIKARRAVVLACGGFEANSEMQKQYWQEKPVLNAAYMGNTGDGILMAQAVGAALWHMWHYHGVYGFRHPDPTYPSGIRPKRLPDWIPGENARADVKMPWIIVDRSGRRYMNEYQPYTQDTTWRAMAIFDPQSMTYPRIPSYMIMDEPG